MDAERVDGGITNGETRKHFEEVAEYKARFQNPPTEEVRKRLNFGSLIKEAAIALREILEEREREDQSRIPATQD